MNMRLHWAYDCATRDLVISEMLSGTGWNGKDRLQDEMSS
jgi:hypothetical protein